jgi:hypothetical protein
MTTLARAGSAIPTQSARTIRVDNDWRATTAAALQPLPAAIRAILYSAFAIGLLRYCHQNKMPHLGVVVIDSPLTSYKKGKVGASADVPIDPGMEEAFWKSLKVIKQGVQVIIIENKEPPPDVATVVQYEWFAGEGARAGERVGFIPAR